MPKTHYEANKKHIYRWVENHREKYNEMQRKYAADYYERNKDMINMKRKQERQKRPTLPRAMPRVSKYSNLIEICPAEQTSNI